MKRKNIFFIDTRGEGKNYGIGTYRRILFHYLLDSNKYNIFWVKINYAATPDVKVLSNSSTSGMISIEISLSFDFRDEFDATSKIAFREQFRSLTCFAILQNLTQCRTGIVHLNSVGEKGMAIVAKQKGFRVIGTQHTALFEKPEFKTNDRADELNWSLFNSEREYLSNLDACIFLSDITMHRAIDYNHICPEKANLIYNGVHFAPPQDNKVTETLKNEMELSSDDFIILYVGRLNRRKGLVELISSFTSFSKNRTKVKLVIVGDGDLSIFANLKDDVRGKILKIGYMTNDRISAIYRLANIGVLPSYSEQSSFSILEMMNYGLPLILSDIPEFCLFKDDFHAIKSAVHKSTYGTVSGIDIESLRICIERLYESKKLRDFLIRNSKELISKKLNSKRMSDLTISLYDKL
ncbi:TIGR04157 family glycosyltransferase [Ravibacter arvi]|uniref:TIGR04157 family glycosyltransferase n=1 Tax=Ravibacter arvi TaxID=2051041 RepID=A0ABP8LKZ4_9BACT